MPDFLAFGFIVAAVIWIIRSVLKPGIDVADGGRRAAGKLAEAVREIQQQTVRTPPGPRSTPQVVPRSGARTSTGGTRPQSALRKPPLEYTLRKVGSLLWPYMLWTGIYGALVHKEGVRHLSLWAGSSYLWFMLFLFSFFVAAPLLRRVPLLLVVVASFAVSMAAPDGTKYLERYFFLMGFFFIGALLQQRPAWLDTLASSKVVAPAAVLAIALSVGSTLTGGINYDARYAVPTLAGIAVLIALAKKSSAAAWSRGLRFVGRNSVVYFVVHYPVMYGTMSLALWLGYRDQPALIYFCALAAGVLVSHLMAALRERAPFTEVLYSLPLGKPRRRRPVAPAASAAGEVTQPMLSESK